jgi:membrane associated rhomboid family serine protease
MLLIPIAQENDTVRRTPWVSYVLIAVNIALFTLIAATYAPRRQAEVKARGEEALQYIVARPYLELPAALAKVTTSEFQQFLAHRRAQLTAQHVPPPEERTREQAELDTLAVRLEQAVQWLPARRFGYAPASGGVFAALSSMFMHAGWLHLLGNMLFLFLSGPFIEDLYGRTVFTAMYFLAGFTATAVFSLHNPESTIPLVGASGAIAGVMGAFLFRLGTQRIRFLIFPIPIIPMLRFKAWLPAYVVLPLWLAQQFWYAHNSDQGPGVAWWAHIGGFAFGAVVAVGMRLLRAEERWINAGIEREIAIVQHPGLEKAVDARTAGNLVLARREIRGVLTAEPQNVDAWTESYEIAVAEGNWDEAGRAAQRVLEMHVRKGEKDLAWRFISDACERVAGALPIRFLMSAAAFLEKEGDGRTALDIYQQVVARAPVDPAAFRASFRCGEILRQAGDPRGARTAYEQARAHPACVEPWPATIDRALAQLGG